jgi:hypothetical protein
MSEEALRIVIAVLFVILLYTPFFQRLLFKRNLPTLIAFNGLYVIVFSLLTFFGLYFHPSRPFAAHDQVIFILIRVVAPSLLSVTFLLQLYMMVFSALHQGEDDYCSLGDFPLPEEVEENQPPLLLDQ